MTVAMDLDLYVSELERSIANVPEVLARWPAFSPALRMHLADELALMLLRQREANESARAEGRATWLASKIVELNRELMFFSSEIASTTGLRVLDLILPESVTGALPSAVVEPPRNEPFALAA